MDKTQFSNKKICLGTEGKKGVVVIGAGPAGVLATRQMKNDFDLLTLEAKSDLGGIWNREYDPSSKTNYEKLYGTSPIEIYKGLYTNNTKQTVTFKDFPHTTERLFPYGVEYLDYMKRYADHFGLRDKMQFNTLVKRLRLIENLTDEEMKEFSLSEEDKKYKYVIQTTPNKEEEPNCGNQIILCDLVVCCTGIFNKPYTPDVKNKEKFEGEQIHSKDYTDMDFLRKKCEGKRVIVVGHFYSARDIVKHICLGFDGQPPISVKSIAQLIRSEKYSKYARDAAEANKEMNCVKVHQAFIESFEGGNKIKLNNGLIEADIIVWATGFHFYHPFLDSKDNIISVDEESNGKMLYPLFLQTFSVNQPSFAKSLMPFTLELGIVNNFERQVEMIRAVFNGEKNLPSKEVMLKSIEDDVEYVRSKGYGKERITMDVQGERDSVTLGDKWQKFTNIKKRNTELDKMMNRQGKLYGNSFNTGKYYYVPVFKEFEHFEEVEVTSDKY